MEPSYAGRIASLKITAARRSAKSGDSGGLNTVKRKAQGPSNLKWWDSRGRPSRRLAERACFPLVPDDVVDVHGASEGDGDTLIEGGQGTAH